MTIVTTILSLLTAAYLTVPQPVTGQDEDLGIVSRAEAFPQDSTERQDSIEETVISTTRVQRQIEGLMTGRLKFSPANISTLPKFMGVNDILKTLQLMPGVQTSGEADSGIYIRGGDPGQTLVSLDGATIYAPSHLLGFFSVFNSDHISTATMLKSGIPASYGGSTSGILDIDTGVDIALRTEGTVNIGLISSQGTLLCPIGRKSQIKASARGTYINYLLKAISGGKAAFQPEYGFQDYNLSWLTKFDDYNILKVNAYYGRDSFNIDQSTYSVDASLRWQNAAASITYERRPENGLDQKHTVSYSLYDNTISMNRLGGYIRMPSSVMDLAWKSGAAAYFRQSRLNFGLNYTYHCTNVQYPQIFGLNDMIDNALGPEPYHTHEFAVYADWSLWFSWPLTIDFGLRYSGAVTGDTFYSGPEPRLSIGYTPRPDMRLRANFSMQRQYLSMVSVSGMGMPTDFWIPVTQKIKPQRSESASLSFTHSLLDGMLEYSVEPYYSRLHHLLEYDGELFDMINRRYETEEHILLGSGQNWGAEFMVKKNQGCINGWISYTLGWAQRSFPDIMDGAVFPAKHDRRHSLNVVANYSPTPRWTFSAVFVYATGTAYTPPKGLYILGENLIQEYGDHNSARMPDYHRLDISATYNFKSKGRCRHSLNLSVYNVYARVNPLYRDISLWADIESRELKLSLSSARLYTIVPSLSYNFKF